VLDELDIKIRFGQRLRDLRKARNVPQDKFAMDVGLDRTYISGIERGKRNVSLVNLERIAKQLDIPMSELFDKI